MIRSFLGAIVLAVALFAAAPGAEQPKPAPIPVSVSGGTPGVNIEFYLNAGKLADATANTTGGADWLLDLSNMGKTKVTVYIDVCKDGKIVKVMFVTGSGQAPPEDEGCNRRLAALSFQSDCAGLQLNLNFSNFAASNAIGCGGLSFRDPKVYGTAGGAIVALALITGSGGDSPTAVATPVVPQQPTVSLPQTPPVNTTSPNPPPVTAPPAVTQVTPRFFIVLVNHPSGASTSLICGIVQIDPPVSGVTWSLAGSGPGVLPNQNVSGTFNTNGQASFRLGISQFGQYTLTLVTNNQGTMQTVTSAVTVNSSSFNCPTVA